MQTRTLGRHGPPVSVIGLGCNNFGRRIDLDASRRVIDRAIDLGITLFDTADIYGSPSGTSEEILGLVLGARRDKVVLATKFGASMTGGFDGKGKASRAYIMSAVENSLRRLRTDRIDLYQLHAPDPVTPIEETLSALDDLIRQGKVRYIGCSNMPGPQIARANATARAGGFQPFVSAQDEYSLAVRTPEAELIPTLEGEGMGLLPFFPLAAGLLTGKYRRDAAAPADSRFAAWPHLAERYLTDANLTLAEALEDFARSRGHTLLQLAFAWLNARSPVASVIAGATTPEQVEMNAAAADWTLSAADLDEVDRISAARPA